MKKGQIIYGGKDGWSRKLFRTVSGITLVDVDGELYTRSAEPWCEPECPVGLKTPLVGKDDIGNIYYPNKDTRTTEVVG